MNSQPWRNDQKAAIIRERFLGLLERHVPSLQTRGDKGMGLCPLHPDKHPSFSVDIARGLWHCFACVRGGGVKALAESLGESWEPLPSLTSYRPRPKIHRQRIDHDAFSTDRVAYEDWCRETFIALTDQYRELCAEREVLEIAYRYAHRHQGEVTPAEFSYWSHRLATVYDALPALEHSLDILTEREHQEARMQWWLEERDNGQSNAR
jgi:hypothetical protein